MTLFKYVDVFGDENLLVFIVVTAQLTTSNHYRLKPQIKIYINFQQV